MEIKEWDRNGMEWDEFFKFHYERDGMEWNETSYRYQKTEWDGMGHMFVKCLGMEWIGT